MKVKSPSKLDRNGYAPSILIDRDYCAICMKHVPLQRHEVFHGPYRSKSKRYGLWVSICDECHRKVHQTDGKLDLRLKSWAQTNAMTVYGWSVDEFRKQFGKNYL